MNIRQIYLQDARYVRNWESSYTDIQFYSLNRKLRGKLSELVDSNLKLSPRELYMAGMVMHHGFTVSSSRRALSFARKSFNSGYRPARTLIAQALDRLLKLQNKPQKFGTQADKMKNGRWKIYRLDGTVTDEERKEYGLPSLKTLISYLNV